MHDGLGNDSTHARRALTATDCLISQSFLLPLAPDATVQLASGAEVAPLLLDPLRKVTPGTARHLALVEAARRLHKQAAMVADRADKESRRP